VDRLDASWDSTCNTWWRAASSGIVTSPAQETQSGSEKEGRKQRGVRTKSACRGQHVEFVVMSNNTFGKFWQKQSRDGDRQCGKTGVSKDSACLLGQHSQATSQGGGLSNTQRHINSASVGSFESNHFSDTGAGTVRPSGQRAYKETKLRGQEFHQQRTSSGA